MAIWVVGTSFDGEDQLDYFVKNNIWWCCNPNHKPDHDSHRQNVIRQRQYFKQIQKEDVLFAKRIYNISKQLMSYRATGIVTSVDYENWLVHVNWLKDTVMYDLYLTVDLHGWTMSLHGPYDYHNHKVQELIGTASTLRQQRR
jgi:hypothetical protein